MSAPALILSTNLSLGKVDKQSLSQQTLMELLIQDLSNTETICGSGDSPKDILDWKGLRFNPFHKVTHINWHSRNLEGSFPLEWVPPTVQSLQVCMNDLHSTIPMSALSARLSDLNLRENAFFGTLDLDGLPPHMESLNVKKNRLSGTLSLIRLPKTLEKLYLGSNNFDGTVTLTHLPDKLAILSLCECRLSGYLDLTLLPPKMTHLYIEHNQFEGETDFSKLPESMQSLDVSGNTKLSGKVISRVEMHILKRDTNVKYYIESW
mmetsp:Transcript_24023/g.37421  ORF Transcript_24023/g.37421 Transcript_24023/m.37421 type:complete len:264 (-) Transcript_24023:9-800(-)